MNQEADIRIERLSPDNRSFLRKRLIGYSIFSLVAIAICIVFFLMAPRDTFLTIALVCFWLLFFGLIVYMFSGVFRDISLDQKLIVRGVIESKASRAKRKSSTINRMLQIGGKQYYVDFRDFASVTAGDTVELHYAKHANVCLGLIVIHSSTVRDIEKQAEDEIKEVKEEYREDRAMELQPEDRQLLWSSFWRWARFRIFAILILGWMLLGLVAGGLWAVALFLFPLPLALLYLIYSLVRKANQIQRDIRGGQKLVKALKVIDKSSYQRRARSYYQVLVKGGKLAVNKKEFDRIVVGKFYLIARAPSSKIILGIQLAE